MKRNFGGLQEELGQALQAALEATQPINRYLGCIQAAESAISRMKDMVLADPFASRHEEIHHFKHEAPELYSQLFYYLTLVDLEGDRLHAGPEGFRVILREKKEELDEYFRRHQVFCRYSSQGFDHMDDHLFIRKATGQWSGDELGAFIPPDLTIGTYWISWIKANDRLRNYIREELAAPEPAAMFYKGAKIRWTGGRTALIETLCALHLAHCFNDGRVTFKEVVAWAEEQLGIKLGQYHVALNEMSVRKEQVRFLKVLVDLMLRKFDSMLD